MLVSEGSDSVGKLLFLMDVNLKLVDVAFCLLFLLWILWDVLKKRRVHGDDDGNNQLLQRERSFLFAKITALLNFIISISYLGFCLHEFWISGTGSNVVVFSTTAWCCACVVAVYSVPKRWPLVLVIWWGYATTCGLLEVIFYVIHRFEFVQVPKFLPKANIVDFASLPLCVLLCFGAMHNNMAKKISDATKPLLADESGHETDPFSRAGIWSQLTFQWLNPLFEKGHKEQLEFEDVPPIPPSEAADEASALLEESLRKQKSQATSLPNAILNAIWTPLVVNAVFAGTCV